MLYILLPLLLPTLVYWPLYLLPGTCTGAANEGAATILSGLLGFLVAPNTNLGFNCTPLALITTPTWYLSPFLAWLVPYIDGWPFLFFTVARDRPFAVKTTLTVSCPVSVIYVYLFVSKLQTRSLLLAAPPSLFSDKVYFPPVERNASFEKCSA